MKRVWLFVLAAFLVTPIAANGDSHGHEESDGDVPALDYRHDAMEAIEYTMAMIAMILQDEVEHTDHLVSLTVALDELASTTGDLFPEGSVGNHALPEIWEQPEKFAEELEKFKTATGALREAAAGGKQLEIALAARDVGRACKSCHEDYREQSED